MPGRRLSRLNEQFRREIAGLLLTGIRDPRLSGIVVTGVEVTSDLSLARVRVRWPEGGEAEARQGLRSATPFIRRSLAGALSIRKLPELRWIEDRTDARARRIEELLREVLPEDGAGPAEDGEEE